MGYCHLVGCGVQRTYSPVNFSLFQLEKKTTFTKKMLAMYGFHLEKYFSEKTIFKNCIQFPATLFPYKKKWVTEKSNQQLFFLFFEIYNREENIICEQRVYLLNSYPTMLSRDSQEPKTKKKSLLTRAFLENPLFVLFPMQDFLKKPSRELILFCFRFIV